VTPMCIGAGSIARTAALRMGLINAAWEKVLAANQETAKEWTFEWIMTNDDCIMKKKPSTSRWSVAATRGEAN
jgi:hypothetical protein